ncbi:SipW-dependent-type signal peptide-containing protein [Brevibacterium casei]|uniref:SipW-cognate class signal peptide n=1 Tax=Brevibacterium casei TaxID=33889 RepID=A0AB34XQ10_9MICO|nr:SipW-dependent-type signal peptide-containing protein [Brevibacterium casei]KZE09936.1 hypothetical protein AVW13_03230 [Brevibacterium casei]
MKSNISLKNTLILSLAAVLGILLGIGGGTLALWSDNASGTGEISSGYEYFAAGRVDDTQAAKGKKASVSLGAAEAETLLKDGEVAVALQTDSLSQGNKGLRYELTPPDWSGGIFGASDVSVFRVRAPSECTVANTPTTAQDLRSTPVSAEYSETTDPTIEYWCVSAKLKDNGEVGQYENTATVTAEDPAGTKVEAKDSWNAKIRLGLDPKQEPNRDIVFKYETFRPGGVGR